MTEPVDVRVLPTFAAGSIEVPWVISAFDERVERPTVWSDHAHPTHELLWNEHGASSVTVGRRTWTITPRLGLWMPAGTVHAASAPAGTWYRASHFTTRRVPSIAEGPVPVEITELLRLLLQRLEDPELTSTSREVTETMVLDVLSPSTRALSVHVPASPLLQPIVQAALTDPADDRSLTDWSAALGVSARTITRAFHQETGLGFAAWTAGVRAQHAARMLVAGEHIEDVAIRLGYRSASAFGVAFRRATGLTPGAFRR